MKLAEMFLGELERESAGTRRVLERAPVGQNAWKPHEKSMELGYLAGLVASMPGWIPMMVNHDSMDIASPEGARFKPQAWASNGDLVRLLDQSLAGAREALAGATDEHLMKPWKLVVAGHVAAERPRYIMIRDSVLNHMAHHRGQLTVYLRLCGAPVPSVYGPSADEGGF